MTGRPREFDADACLDEVMRTFWRQGYENTAVSDLVACSGVGRQSLYNAFGDKCEIFQQALERYEACVLRPAWALLGGAGALRDKLRRLVDGMRRMEEKGCLTVIGVVESDAPAHRETVRAHVRGWERAAQRACARAAANGELRDGVAPNDLGRLLVATILGAATLSRADAPTAGILGAFRGLEAALA